MEREPLPVSSLFTRTVREAEVFVIELGSKAFASGRKSMTQNKLGISTSLILLIALVFAGAFLLMRNTPDNAPLPLATTPQPTNLPTSQPTTPPVTPTTALTVIYLSPVVATGTYIPLTTPNPTEVAHIQTGQLLSKYFNQDSGIVLAQGTEATPLPEMYVDLRSYQVAEIELPQQITYTVGVPISGTMQPQLLSFRKVWRLKIIGNFLVTNSSYNVYLDDTFVGVGGEFEGGLTTILFDPSPLIEGARIGVSYGHGPIIYLPERLHLIQQPSP